jgi:hypothetical protein
MIEASGQTHRQEPYPRGRHCGRGSAPLAGGLVAASHCRCRCRSKLKALHDELIQAVALKAAVDDWLADGLDDRSAEAIAKYRNVLKPVLAEIGGKTLANLTAAGRELPRLLLELVRGYFECLIDLARGIAAHACVEPYGANVRCGNRLSCRRTTAERPVNPREQLIDLLARVAAHDKRERRHVLAPSGIGRATTFSKDVSWPHSRLAIAWP